MEMFWTLGIILLPCKYFQDCFNMTMTYQLFSLVPNLIKPKRRNDLHRVGNLMGAHTRGPRDSSSDA